MEVLNSPQVFIRHSQAGNNVGPFDEAIVGSDKPLTPLGFRQRAGLALRLIQLVDEETLLPPKRIVTSPFMRTTQTALQIAKTFGAELKTDPRLREVYHGIWDGKKAMDLVKELDAMSIEEKVMHRPEHGGENFQDMADRVANSVYEHLAEEPNTFFVGHNHSLECYIGSRTRYDPTYWQNLNLGNASVSLIFLQPGGLGLADPRFFNIQPLTPVPNFEDRCLSPLADDTAHTNKPLQQQKHLVTQLAR